MEFNLFIGILLQISLFKNPKVVLKNLTEPQEASKRSQRLFGTLMEKHQIISLKLLLFFASYSLVLSAQLTSTVNDVIIRIQLLGPLRHDVWPPYPLDISSFGA